jgi:antitoxin HigA-1
MDLLLALIVAQTLTDLSPLKSVELHRLKCERGWTVGDGGERTPAHLLFLHFDAHGVEIVDYHRDQTMPLAAHPGRLLKRELGARSLNANRLALDLGVPSGRITDIINGRRSITADTRPVRAQFQIDVQRQYNLVVAGREEPGAEITRRVRPSDAA